MALRSAHNSPGFSVFENDVAFIVHVIGGAVLGLGALLWVFG